MITYVNNIRPRSLQRKGGTEPYKELLRNDFKSKYGSPASLYQNNIYSKIIYITDFRTNDIDNIIKPILDSFNGIIYNDDNQVSRVEAITITKDDYNQIGIDYTKISDSTTVNLLDQYLVGNEEHIVYYEVGNFNLDMVKVGDEIA